MSLTTLPANRSEGLVWLDPALADLPATHVLIAGIGRFDSQRVPALSSPPVSARAIAGWFLDGACGRGQGFDNPARPLASLAMLLSEAEDKSLSEVEGGPVPRADFATLKKAVENWIRRSERNSQNTMILVLASHGVSADRRTAILCEDYGTDEFNLEAGMTETDQLVLALGQVRVAGKLVIFDCCRKETDVLSTQQTIGLPLIGKMNRAELPRRPQVMHSTLLLREAFGRKDGPTLFTESLLQALNGLAANPNENWRIGSSSLSTVTAKLLGLQKLSETEVQVPDFQLNAEFPVAMGPPTDRVALYLSIEPPWSEQEWEVELVDSAGVTKTAAAVREGERFVRLDLPARSPHTIRLLDAAGAVHGEATADLAPPVAFQPIPDPYAVVPRRTKSTTPCAEGQARVTVRGAPGVARIDPIGRPAAADVPNGAPAAPQRIEIRPDGGLNDLSAGRHRIAISRPDGATFAVEVDLRPGEEVDLDVPGLTSPHEWMTDAVLAGVIPAGTQPGDQNLGPSPVVLTVDPRTIPQVIATATHPVVSASELTISPGPRDGRFHLFEIYDNALERYPARTTDDPRSQPVWISAEAPLGAGPAVWREVAFVPSLGSAGRWMVDARGAHDPWLAQVLVDAAPGRRAHLLPYVSNRRWGSLLAFLGRRDFPNSAAALETLLGEHLVEMALWDKIRNPLAALAAVLTAIACGPIADSGVHEEWVRNLTNWFPGLPDGAVALGRHLQREGRPQEARQAFRDAAGRGVPVFSLAVDWLAEGLETLDPDNAAETRRWSRITDPEQAFTVLKLQV